jgi:4-hydroxy-2-oxoglutarate aldolase
MPANTNVDMSAELIIKLSQHPNIAAVKESGGNLAKIGEIIHRAKPEFQVLAGSAGFLYPAFCLGAVGGVLALANIAPELCCRLEELFRRGKAEEARKLQLRLIAPNNAVTAKYGVAGLKAAMDMLGYYGGLPRSPLMPLGEAEKETLRGILKEAQLMP